MDRLEFVAPTYQEALDHALDELDRELDEVEVEVLDDGQTSGQVRLRVVPIDGVLDEAQDWLLDVLDQLDMPCTVGLVIEPETVTFDIETDEDAGVLIGRKGQTLDALQYLLNAAYARDVGKRLVVDVQDYRARQRDKLIEQAVEAADRVRTTGRPLRLAPMSAGDRRIVHEEIKSFGDLETNSQGEEPHRCVVIYPKRDGAGEAPRPHRPRGARPPR